jgi:hypothetical protein
VLRSDPHMSSTTAVLRPSRHRLGVDPSDVRMSTHVALLSRSCPLPECFSGLA